MKIKKLSTRKTLLLASASKLALAPGLVAADSHGYGKGDEGPPPDPAPQLKLNQVAFPADAFIPAFNDPEVHPGGSMWEDEYDLYDNSGVIFVGEMPDADSMPEMRDNHMMPEGEMPHHKAGMRMDFVITNIRNDRPVNVFLVMGTELAPDPEGDLFPGINHSDWLRSGHDRGEWDNWEEERGGLWDEIEEKREHGAPDEEIQPLLDKVHRLEGKFVDYPPPDGVGQIGPKPRPGKGNPPPPVRGGEICVDIDDAKMDIIAGVGLQPIMPLPYPGFQLGHPIGPHFNSTVISVWLSKEKLRKFAGQEVFFQAAAIPSDTDNPFPETQVSECDRYLIDHIVDADPDTGTEADPGTKEPPGTPTDPGTGDPTNPDGTTDGGDKGVG